MQELITREEIVFNALKKSIMQEIEYQAINFQNNTEREFEQHIPQYFREELVKYLVSEKFYASLLNNNQTLYVSWD